MKKIEAYLSDWRFVQDLKKEQADLLTHINYSFGHVVDGCVSIAHLENLDRFKQLMAQFPQLKYNLSVGGWGADGFSPAVATAEGREKLASSAMAVLEELNLDGLDWDWEYPGSDMAGIACAEDDPVNMSAFLVLMREKMNELTKRTGKYYELSIAVGANRTQDYLWEQVVPVLDSVNLMTYDMSMDGCVGHVTNLRKTCRASYSVEQSVAAFMAVGVPREKLLIGGTMYFHCYYGVEAEEPFAKAYKEKGRSVIHDNVDEAFVQMWDEEAQAGYYVKGDTLLSGDDVRSMDMKRAYIEAEDLAGIILWELNEDTKNVLLPHIGNR